MPGSTKFSAAGGDTMVEPGGVCCSMCAFRYDLQVVRRCGTVRTETFLAKFYGPGFGDVDFR